MNMVVLPHHHPLHRRHRHQQVHHQQYGRQPADHHHRVAPRLDHRNHPLVYRQVEVVAVVAPLAALVAVHSPVHHRRRQHHRVTIAAVMVRTMVSIP